MYDNEEGLKSKIKSWSKSLFNRLGSSLKKENINIRLVIMIEIKKSNNKEKDLPLFKHGVYIEDIIWRRGDGKILFEC